MALLAAATHRAMPAFDTTAPATAAAPAVTASVHGGTR